MKTNRPLRVRAISAITAAASCGALWAVVAVAPAGAHDHGAMTDREMIRMREQHYAKHPIRYGNVPPGQRVHGPAASFVAFNFAFDNGAPTVVDTAYVSVGDAVEWNWIDGFHTVTNGTGALDPNSGLLFDVPLDSVHPGFAYVFTVAGTFPFYCVPHEGFEMKGVVQVRGATEVTLIDRSTGRVGFTASPAPNPSRNGFTFAFAVPRFERARVEVFDAAGRLATRVLDRDLEPGVYRASWDGRSLAGRARPGAYWIRLNVAGVSQSRRVVVEQ